MTTTWRPSSPESIDTDLATLWREAGRDGPVSRALMSNLVVVSPNRAFSDVETLARKHPARTILLSYTAGQSEASAPEGVRIGLMTFGAEDARYGLEMIAVHTTCADASLTSIVRRLTIGSVPTSVWWTSDISQPAPPETIAGLGRQLVYNSAQWRDVNSGVAAATALLKQHQPPDLVDLNWRRVAPLRDALVHALRTERHPEPVVSSIQIAHSAGEAAVAWLVAGWLSARLKNLPLPDVREEHGEELLTVRVARPTTPIVASMNAHRIEVRSGEPPFVVPVPAETETDAVAAELLSLAPDVGLKDALRALSARPLP